MVKVNKHTTNVSCMYHLIYLIFVLHEVSSDMALFCLSLPLPLTFLRFQLGLYSGGSGGFSFFSPLLLFLFSCCSKLPLLLQLPDSTLKNVTRPFYCVSEENSKKKIQN
jgi:hypothetical protein